MLSAAPSWRGFALAYVTLVVAASAFVPAAVAAGGDHSPAPAVDGDDRSASEPSRFRVAGVASDQSRVAARTSASADIELAFELFLTPDRPGEVRVRLAATIPDRVTDLTVAVPRRTTPVSTDGFESGEHPGQYVWDGATETPTITYRLPVNDSGGGMAAPTATSPARPPAVTPWAGDYGGPFSPPSRRAAAGQASGDYIYVDPGPWALVELPRWQVDFTYHKPEPTVVDTYRVHGEGAVGHSTAFLGPHETVARTAGDQAFRLVVPAAADPVAAPAAVLDALANASQTLDVGDRDASVFGVVAPTTVSWGPSGLATGDADFWVRADEPLTTADNVWLHEYVHTRQDYRTRSGTRWLDEGVADYYAAKLALQFDLVGFEEFAGTLARGTASRYSNVVLADPTTWTGLAQYNVGALVTGELDRRIALGTAGVAFEDVFARLNRHDGAVSRSDFRTMLRDVAGPDVVDAARRYTTTTARPSVWNRSQHNAAFGTLDPRIETKPVAYAVRGPYRNRSGLATPPAVVVTGETLSVRVRVENTGGSPGVYDLALTVGGERVAAANGTLAHGETTTIPLAYTVRTANAPVALNGRPLPVRLRRPATADVTDLSVRGSPLRPGETATVAVTLGNPTDRPANRTVTLVVDGQRVATATGLLAPGGERTLTVPVTFERGGSHTVAVGDRSVTVTVVTPTPSPTPPPTATSQTTAPSPARDTRESPADESPAARPSTGESPADGGGETAASGPGFGGIAALVVLFAAALLWRR